MADFNNIEELLATEGLISIAKVAVSTGVKVTTDMEGVWPFIGIAVRGHAVLPDGSYDEDGPVVEHRYVLDRDAALELTDMLVRALEPEQ
jgi:hypothetical protein